MTRETQKKEEVYFANTASKLLDERWIVEEAPNEIDWPDLVVTNDGKKFGLEIRNIFKDESQSGSKLKKGESKRRKLLASLAENYYKASDIPISLKVNGHLTEGVLEKLNSSLLDVSKKLEEFEMKKLTLGEGETVTNVYVRRLPGSVGNYNRWQYVGDSVGWVSTMTLQDLERPIREKGSKIDKYRKNIEDIRLLMVLDRTKNSGRVQIPSDIKVKDVNFNEVYVMSYPDEIFRVNRN